MNYILSEMNDNVKYSKEWDNCRIVVYKCLIGMFKKLLIMAGILALSNSLVTGMKPALADVDLAINGELVL